MSDQILSTSRLILRPFAPHFANIFFQSIERYRDVLKVYFPKTCATNVSVLATEAYMVNKQQERSRKETFANAIFLKGGEENKFIGMISIRNIDWRVPKGELAYFILPPFQEKGYAKEALLAFRDWGFKELGLKRLYLETGINNLASQELSKSCGFKQEGILKQHYRNGNGDLEDTVVLGLVNETDHDH